MYCASGNRSVKIRLRSGMRGICAMDEVGNKAGASARAEYERRRARHREIIRRRRPLIIGLGLVIAAVGLALMGSQPLVGWGLVLVAVISTINSLFIAPNHISAWATGADGEVRTARFLEPLHAEGFAILHDRRIPGGSANIDHIVIGPPGIFVVETKSLAGDLRIRGGAVYVSGHRKTAMIEEAKREALAVQVALALELEALGLAVVPVVCVHRANLPWLGGGVDGVRIVSGRELVKRLRKAPIRLGPEEADRLVRAADQRLARAAG